MEKKEKQSLSDYAKEIFATQTGIEECAILFENLKQAVPFFESVPPEKFRQEFLCLRLALTCFSWGQLCADYGLEDPAMTKAFLKVVTDSFQTPKSLGIAAVFSEYYQSPSLEDAPSPVIALAVHFLGRLVAKRSEIEKDVSASLFPIVQALESLRTSFENEFFQFLDVRRQSGIL